MDTIINLYKNFNNYLFFENDHYYTYNGKRVKTSVTQFIATKHKEFDKIGLSSYVAKRDGKSQECILAEWDKISNIACTTGTLLHLHAEHLANNKIINIDFNNISKNIQYEVAERITKLAPMLEKFFSDMQGKLIPIRTEFTVGYKDIIAGNIDLLCWNIEDQEFQIYDYKTNKDIKLSNNYQKLLDEFSFLDDCEFNKYSIQLGIYKALIEAGSDIKIGKRFLVWLNEKNESYKLFRCLDLDDSIGKALNNLIEERKEKCQK